MTAQTRTPPVKPSRTYSKRLRREGFGVIMLVLLFIVIIGPMIAVILWAFAEQWRYPSLIPTQWGLSFWYETLARADIKSRFR